jgi:hypothetical protein
MQHWNFSSPAWFSVSASLPPGGTNVVSLEHSGAMSGVPDSAFNSGTIPPPKDATRVNVCTSPPLLTAMSASPSFASVRDGALCHAPANWWAINCAINSGNGIPWFRAQSMPFCANDGASQASIICTWRVAGPAETPVDDCGTDTFAVAGAMLAADGDVGDAELSVWSGPVHARKNDPRIATTVAVIMTRIESTSIVFIVSRLIR